MSKIPIFPNLSAILASLLGVNYFISYRGNYESQSLEYWVKDALQQMPAEEGIASFSGAWSNHADGIRGFVSRCNYGTSLTYTGFAIQYDSNTILFFTCYVSNDKTISDFKSKSL